ncbi:MAG: hypothetical protein ISR51_06515 [Rhodospirillales bacterium]|nr:hypothetical protein [Alphaproteobacteria bacterium]MBL6948312.1 hypothetical protein [Rhodospirillales bacterium]
MSQVTPPPPPPAPPPSSPAAQPKAVVANPPEAFARQIALGARLEATITGSTQKGHYEVQTPYGRVTLQPNTPLPNDGVLQLQLLSKGGQLQFLISTINGQPALPALRALGLLPGLPPNLPHGLPSGLPGDTPLPQTGAGQTSTPGTAPGSAQGSAPGAAPGGQPPGPLTVGANLNATLLIALAKPGAQPGAGTPLPGQNPAPGATSNIPGIQSGTGLPGASAALPGQTPSPSGPAAQTAPGAASTGTPGGATLPPGSPAPGQATPHTGLADLTAGTRFLVRITAFQPSPAAGVVVPPQSGGTPAPGSILTGTVTGTASPSGYPVVQTHFGSLAVATRTALPIGSQVTFEVLSLIPPSNEATGGAKPQTLPAQILSRQWPALQDAVRTLEEINPTAAQQLIQAILPRPGPALGANILFFMMALTGGNVQNWFGDAPSRALLKGKPDLVSRIRDDLRQINRTAREPGPGEWRNHLIPFHNGVDIAPLRLSLQTVGEDDEDAETSGRKGTRFVIDLDLTRIGRFQLDGRVQQRENRMDLVVRTETRLSGEIENGIRDIFQEATEVTGLKGGVAFQAAPANFVEIHDNGAADEPVGLLV